MCVNNTSELWNIIYNILIVLSKTLMRISKNYVYLHFHLKLFIFKFKHYNNGDMLTSYFFLPKKLLILRKHQPKSIIELN